MKFSREGRILGISTTDIYNRWIKNEIEHENLPNSILKLLTALTEIRNATKHYTIF
jgi:hypothetical protein